MGPQPESFRSFSSHLRKLVGFLNLGSVSLCRLDLNNPPTPVGGISEFSFGLDRVDKYVCPAYDSPVTPRDGLRSIGPLAYPLLPITPRSE
jgi:hypothetical protein